MISRSHPMGRQTARMGWDGLYTITKAVFYHTPPLPLRKIQAGYMLRPSDSREDTPGHSASAQRPPFPGYRSLLQAAASCPPCLGPQRNTENRPSAKGTALRPARARCGTFPSQQNGHTLQLPIASWCWRWRWRSAMEITSGPTPPARCAYAMHLMRQWKLPGACQTEAQWTGAVIGVACTTCYGAGRTGGWRGEGGT
jgi:hypothetical protein